YEDETSKRTDLEFSLMELKKDLDVECLRRTELESKLKGLQSFVELMKTIYEQLEERAACSAKFGNSLQSSRSEIADLNVHIQKLRSQILSIRSHRQEWSLKPQLPARRALEQAMDLPSAAVVSVVQSRSGTAASKPHLSRAPSQKKKNRKGHVIKITEMSEKFFSQESEASE
ncbi:hypothetical protein MC885_009512, partial [Smutsia gigantea]